MSHSLEFPVRLADGNHMNEGRVEIFDHCSQQWGTVCYYYGWRYSDESNVICRQLGYPAAKSWGWGSFGPGTGPILLTDDYHSCHGYESAINHCYYYSGWYRSSCSHSYDVRVVCSLQAPEGEWMKY